MKELQKATKEFKEKDFQTHKTLFQGLEEGQSPHTLFIGCSDSRVVPSMITQSAPGELFLVRNVANMVPPLEQAENFPSTVSAMEYAVQVLNVKNIVVCGHSNCGGCAALVGDPKKLDALPQTRKWLELARGVKEKVQHRLPQDNPGERGRITEQANVLEQMENLLSYPFIREAHEKGELNILGWHYVIHTGEVFQYNKDKDLFEKLN